MHDNSKHMQTNSEVRPVNEEIFSEVGVDATVAVIVTKFLGRARRQTGGVGIQVQNALNSTGKYYQIECKIHRTM